MTIGAGYEEIVGVSQAQVDAYCSMTGDDPITVYGALEANGIVVHGDEPSELDTHVVGAPWWQQSPLNQNPVPKRAAPRAVPPRAMPRDGYEAAAAAADEDAAALEAQAGLLQAEAARAAAMQAEEAAAALAMEQQARKRGAVAKVSTGGGCRCPKCNAQLKLILAPPPAVAPGRPAGVVAAKRAFAVGDRVVHHKVGAGHITDIRNNKGAAGGAQYRVQFENGKSGWCAPTTLRAAGDHVISGDEIEVFGAPRPDAGGRPRPGAPSGGGRPGQGAPPKRPGGVGPGTPDRPDPNTPPPGWRPGMMWDNLNRLHAIAPCGGPGCGVGCRPGYVKTSSGVAWCGVCQGSGRRDRYGRPLDANGNLPPDAPSKKKNYIYGDEIDVFGAPVAKMAVAPALRAATPGSCLCSCPSCGTVLCLSVGPGGYDAKKVNAQLPNMYAAAAQAIHGDITVFGSDSGGLFPGQIGFDPETISY